MGLEIGRDKDSPLCNSRSKNPASIRASLEKGGVFTTLWSHTRGLSFGLIPGYYMSKMTYCQVQNGGQQPNRPLERTQGVTALAVQVPRHQRRSAANR